MYLDDEKRIYVNHNYNMMNYLGLLTIALASFHGGSATLADDLDEFQSLFPSAELGNLIHKYYENDDQFKKLILESHYSPDHQQALMDIQKMPEIEELCEWVNAHANVSDPFQPEIVLKHPHRTANSTISEDLGGWKGFVKEFRYIFPMEDWIELRERKVERGGIFAEFYGKLLDMKKVYERIQKLPSFSRYVQQMEKLGVDYNDIYEFSYQLVGWQ